MKSRILPLLLPSFLYATGRDVLLPVLPLYARHQLHATDTDIGVLLATLALGKLLAALPLGIVVQQKGSRLVYSAALGVDAFGSLIALLIPTVWALASSRLVAGMAFSAFLISRQTLVAEEVALEERGQAMSAVGGCRRWAGILGPALGAVLAQNLGVQAVFFVQMLMSLLALTLTSSFLGCERKTKAVSKAAAAAGRGAADVNYREVIRRGGCIFLIVGLFNMPLFIVRQARNVLIPLIGDEIGLSQTDVGIVTSFGYLCDAVCFPVSGYIMDKFGRRFTGIPSSIVLG